jgi:heat shock protein HslJ
MLLAACGGGDDDDPAVTTTTTTTAAATTTTNDDGGSAAPELAGTSWNVTDYALDGSITNVWPDTEVTVAFATDGTVSGSTGCNEYAGPYVTEGPYDPFEEGVRDDADGQTIDFGPLVVTERACTPQHVMDQEGEYLALLDETGRWLIGRGNLLLRGDDGSFLVEAEPAG